MSINAEQLINFLHEELTDDTGPASDATVEDGAEIWPPCHIPHAIHITGILELRQLAHAIIDHLENETTK